jgi:hypothetical protein
MIKLSFLLFFLFHVHAAFSAEVCSRVATINYQEVLVDVSANNRGEGLRYFLEKDAVSKDLLDEYQKNNRPTWRSAALSTVGTTLIMAGLLRSGEGENEEFTGRQTLLLTGAITIAVSYLISKTNQRNNEYLLSKSIEEYNKRNTPRIYLSPMGSKSNIGLGAGVTQEF